MPSGGVQHNAVPGREFDLGLGTGLRAFPAHAFTGDRYFVLASEYRYLVWPRLLGLVGVGAARSPDMPARGTVATRDCTGTEFGLGLATGLHPRGGRHLAARRLASRGQRRLRQRLDMSR